MKPSTKFVLAFFSTIALTGVASAALSLAVRYKPYGVPDHRRIEYEQKVTEQQRRHRLVEELADDAKPMAVIKNRIHDFGMLDPHTTTSHAFDVSNEGQHPLTLSVSQTSCKCTVGKLDQEIVMPGETTKVTLTWNTGYQTDHYEQTATLTTNDPLQRSISLKVQGEIRAELIAPAHVNFPRADIGQLVETDFLVHSQLWNDFTIKEISSDLQAFMWSVEPVFLEDPELGDHEAKSAWRIKIAAVGSRAGEIAGTLTLTVVPDNGGDPLTRTLSASGKVRAPVNFYSNDIHKTEGLDIGTLVSGKEYLFHVVVRSRGDVARNLEVLDIKPDQLQTSLEPLSQEGSYRLTIRVPADCPRATFNSPQKHGYVQVGDPQDKSFSNWFPLHGAVVVLAK